MRVRAHTRIRESYTLMPLCVWHTWYQQKMQLQPTHLAIIHEAATQHRATVCLVKKSRERTGPVFGADRACFAHVQLVEQLIRHALHRPYRIIEPRHAAQQQSK